MSIVYDSIGMGFTVRVKLSELSSRDQVQLMKQLMDNLGITDRFAEEADATARAQQIIVEQWNKSWAD